MQAVAVRHMALLSNLPESVKQNLTFRLDNPVTDSLRIFHGYEVTREGVWIPRAYDPEFLSKLEDAGWKQVEIPFYGELKPHQQILAERFLSTPYKNGIISAGTGSGKTVLALYIASKLGLKTLVVTHTDRIFRQWRERIEQFCKIKPSFIRSVYCDYSAPITVGMLQTLALSKHVDREALYKQFGLVIYDEVHRMPTEKFSRVAQMFWDKYRLGLSATVRRRDGLHYLLKYHLGQIISYEVEPAVIPKVVTIYFIARRDYPIPMRGDKVIMPQFLNKISRVEERNKLIALLIEEAYRKGRRAIVLSDRLEMLSHISSYLNELKIKHGWITGSRVSHEDRNVLLATYGAAGEGLDIPELDLLILASPRSDIRQAIGRVLRPKKKRPIIIDIVDSGSKLILGMYKRREATYRSIKCDITTKYMRADSVLEKFAQLTGGLG